MSITIPSARRRPRTARDPIQPSDLPGLLMWHRADAGVLNSAGSTAGIGQVVSQWLDLSGNNCHLSPSLGSGATLATGINGQAALSFAGNTGYLCSRSVFPAARTELFIWRGTITSPGVLRSGAFSASNTHAIYIQTGVEVDYYASGVVTNNVSLSNTGTIAANTPTCTVERMASETYTGVLYRNGVPVQLINNGLPPIPTNSDAALQIGVYKTNGQPFNGTISEHILYNRPLSQAELAKLYQYVYSRYKISLGAQPPLLVFAGNSLTAGVNASNPATTSYPAVTVSTLAGYGGYSSVNAGIGSLNTTQMIAYGNQNIDQLVRYGSGAKKTLLAWELTNTLNYATNGTGTVNQNLTYSEIVNYCLSRKAQGWRVIVFTCLPRGAVAQFETDRQAVNTLIRANWASFADGLCDVGNDATIGVAGAQNNTTYYSVDLVHLTDAGYAIVANTYAAPAIKALG